jgi:flagellar protein FliJ
MPRPFPLQRLLDLARHRADAAARRLHQLKARWLEAEAKLEELRKFRREYEGRLRHSTVHGMRVHLLRDFHAFMAKLDTAIRAQSEEVRRCHLRWDEVRREWQQHHRKLDAFDVLAKRHASQELYRENKREQRQQDELAAKSSAGDNGVWSDAGET